MRINYFSFTHLIVGHGVKNNNRVKLSLDYFCLTQSASLESRTWAQPVSDVHCASLALNYDAVVVVAVVVVSMVSVSLHACGVQGTL